MFHFVRGPCDTDAGTSYSKFLKAINSMQKRSKGFFRMSGVLTWVNWTLTSFLLMKPSSAPWKYPNIFLEDCSFCQRVWVEKYAKSAQLSHVVKQWRDKTLSPSHRENESVLPVPESRSLQRRDQFAGAVHERSVRLGHFLCSEERNGVQRSYSIDTRKWTWPSQEFMSSRKRPKFVKVSSGLTPQPSICLVWCKRSWRWCKRAYWLSQS